MGPNEYEDAALAALDVGGTGSALVYAQLATMAELRKQRREREITDGV